MKRFALFGTVLLLVMALTACGGAPAPQGTDDVSTPEVSSSADASVETAPDTSATASTSPSDGDPAAEQTDRPFTMTLPASLVSYLGETIADTEALGVTSIANEDGSLTFTFTEEQRQAMLDQIKTGMEEQLATLPDQRAPSIQSVQLSEDLRSADILVKDSSYSSGLDRFAELPIYFGCAIYQYFDGVSEAEIQVSINVVDTSSGETIATHTYPQDLTKDIVGSLF